MQITRPTGGTIANIESVTLTPVGGDRWVLKAFTDGRASLDDAEVKLVLRALSRRARSVANHVTKDKGVSVPHSFGFTRPEKLPVEAGIEARVGRNKKAGLVVGYVAIYFDFKGRKAAVKRLRDAAATRFFKD